MNVRPLFQDVYSLLNLPVRAYSGASKGIKYCGFTYYPRNENFEDPPYEPSKLFVVRRLKSMKGRNPVERNALALLNIDGLKKNNAHINIVKNIPATNALLWKVKHLVDIKPITWKGELPKDFLGTYLRDTGELVISPKLKVTEEQLQKTEETLKYETKPERKYLAKYLRNKWWEGYYGSLI